LPPRLTTEEVARVLVACREETPQDVRDRAILFLLAHLGLRAQEITTLCLEAIDWRRGHLVMRSGKTHAERVLPLSQEGGSALVTYLTQGRPASTSRVVLLHYRPPFRPFAGASAITQIARRALLRAGVTVRPRMGAPTFRHTIASQMVNQGARFQEVADILGHRSLQTTGIYAKLALEALTQIALPWGGGT
jgi:site-specific recombinase XerD